LWGRVYLDCWWELDIVDKTRPYKIRVKVGAGFSCGGRVYLDCSWELYRFRLHRNDLTTEGAENAEGENTEMNNSDATGFDIRYCW
jgi:hypothetical protein